MEHKLNDLEKRYDELQQRLADPSVVTDVKAYRETMKSVSEIGEVVSKYRELKDVRKRLAGTREMISSLKKGEEELRELAELELSELEAKEPGLVA